AQLTDLSEFVTGASVPTGSYVSVTLNVDFSQADIEVDNGAGVGVPAASILDAQGAAVSTLAMVVKFDSARQLKVGAFTSTLLDLAFSLAASNTVDMTNPLQPVVTVSPLLLADVDPVAPRPHRIRGPIDSVSGSGGSFTLVLRPFNLLQGDHGRLTFTTNT